MPPTKESKLAAVFVVAAVVAAVAGECVSVNRHGGVVDAKTDVRYAVSIDVTKPKSVAGASSATPENSVAPAVSGNGAKNYAKTKARPDGGNHGWTASASKAAAPVVGDVPLENACPNYRGGGPCTTTPHVKWPCNHQEVAMLKKTCCVYEIWCMEGTTEVRIDGDWPPPATTTEEGTR